MNADMEMCLLSDYQGLINYLIRFYLFYRTAVNAQSGVKTPAAGIITGKCTHITIDNCMFSTQMS